MADTATVNELVLRWQELCEQGRAVSAEELCAGRPDLLDDLRHQIEALLSMEQFLGATGGTPESAGRAEAPTLRLGEGGAAAAGAAPLVGARYRPLRLHAQGGLGEVYVARDEELSREVALKRMRRPHAGDAASRRFLREGEITGGLEHPGVVPVYGLTHDADGQPCYAMRFVRGQTLQEAIARFHATDEAGRGLALRQLLGRFVAVCNTIAYAHSRGVVHRDLKPANIMLGDYGETLVVDWGLAKRLGDASEARPSDGDGPRRAPGDGRDDGTATGDVLGTPAFMSPEQAAGHHDAVGPASDIYGLGATLYALLTGRPRFVAGSVAEVLRQVERGDFPPPRQLRPQTPRALEAICLKAMAREPAARYATALDLAADLERWLADEPVRAYREPWTGRVRRWLRRHRRLTAGAAGLLVTAVAALAIGIGIVNQEKNRTAQEKQRAERALAAESQAKRRTRQSLDDMSSQVIEGWLSRQRGKLEPAQEEFLKKALVSYREFAEESGDSEEVRNSVAEAHHRVGIISQRLGQHQAAEEAYGRAIAYNEQLTADFAGVAKYRQGLAASHHNRSVVLGQLGKHHEAEAASRESLRLQAQLVADFPTLPLYRQALASDYIDLGVHLGKQGKRGEAEVAYRDALKIQKQLVTDFPAVTQYRSVLATSHNNLGVLLHELGKDDEAEAAWRDALEIQTQLAADFPTVPLYRLELARSYNGLGSLLNGLGKVGEAEAAIRQALTTQAQLAADFPAVPQYRQELAVSYSNLGVQLHDLGKLGEAEAAWRDALKIQAQLADDFPGVPQYRKDLAGSQNNPALLLHGLGKHVEAEAAFRDVIRTRARLVADFPTVAEYREKLASSHYNLGRLLAARGKRDEARAAAHDALRIETQLTAEFPTVPQYRHMLARSQGQLGALLRRDLGRRGEAEAIFRDALKTQAQLADDFPSVADYQNDLAITLRILAELSRDNNEFAQARELLERADRHHQAVLKANPRSPLYRDCFQNNRALLASTLAGLGDHVGAVQVAEQLAALGWNPADDAYNATCAMAQCVPVVGKDAKLTEAERRELAQSYADQALALLRQAITKGYKDAAHMKKDSDLDPLRQLQDFKQLMAELERSMP